LLHNLCHNAKKAGADHIMIIAHQVGSGIIIDFADNGPGISEDIQSKLFTAFTTSTSGSTGLGLCIARDAARVHGGDLQLLKSDSKGTTFRLHLPPMSANLDDYDRYQIQVFSNENVVDANCFIPIKIKS
jgi:signal transduction histidine kinase